MSRIKPADCQNRYCCVSAVDDLQARQAGFDLLAGGRRTARTPLPTCGAMRLDCIADQLGVGVGAGASSAASTRRSACRNALAARVLRTLGRAAPGFDAGERDEEPFAAFAIDLEQGRIVQHLVELRAALHRARSAETAAASGVRLDAAAHQRRALFGERAHLRGRDHDGQQQREPRPTQSRSASGCSGTWGGANASVAF